MDKWREELEVRLLEAVGGSRVLAKGRVYEHKRLPDEIHITGPGSSLLVTSDDIVWSSVRGHTRKLPFGAIRSYSEGHQYHRYVVLLEHDEVEFVERVPGHTFLWWRWGVKWVPRIRDRTYLAFSNRETAAAVAIRSGLLRHRITSGPTLEIPEPTRAERTAESEAELHARPD